MYQWDGPSGFEILLWLSLLGLVYFVTPVVAGVWAGMRVPNTMTISAARGTVVGLLVGLSGIPLNFLWLFVGRSFLPESFYSPLTTFTRMIPVLHLDAGQLSVLAGPVAIAMLVVLATRQISGRIAERE